MLTATQLKRIFILTDGGEEVKLADPSAAFSPESVLNFYAQTYPILTTAKIDGPAIQDDEIQFRFVTTIGTKG